MDQKIKAVLNAYHARMKDEEKGVFHTPGGEDREWRDKVLLPVGPDAGRFINIMARSLDAPHILELGTSYGYSAIWLAEAAQATGGRVTTTELQDYKAEYAREMAQMAGLDDLIDFRVGDALEIIASLPQGVDFVLLDLWKDLYIPCLEAVTPKLNPGAIIVSDNMISPGGPNIEAYAKYVRKRDDLRSVLLPVGQGLEISVYEPG